MTAMTTFRINNGTSFPLMSVVIDGVERIPQLCVGYNPGTYFEAQVTANVSHTWTAANGGVSNNTTCPEIVHETFGATFNQPAGLYQQTITNGAFERYVNDARGYTYSCWEGIYSDTVGNTRIARLRLNNGGSWRFQETYNIGGAVARSAQGTSWPEQTRTIDHQFTYRIANAMGFWSARYVHSAGANYISNVCTNATCTAEYLYLRQTTPQGVPTNCPP